MLKFLIDFIINFEYIVVLFDCHDKSIHSARTLKRHASPCLNLFYNSNVMEM